MTPVYKLSANSVKNGRTVYGSMLAGNAAFLPTSFESIATVTVGSGGAADVEFTSIPGTYTHLQIRGIASTVVSASMLIRCNSDSTNTYWNHELVGDGSNASSTSRTPRTGIVAAPQGMSATADIFAGFVIDILDYANTNKYKTFRILNGNDLNGSGYLWFNSGAWPDTSAITNIKLVGNGQNFKQHTTFALYGIKGA